MNVHVYYTGSCCFWFVLIFITRGMYYNIPVRDKLTLLLVSSCHYIIINIFDGFGITLSLCIDLIDANIIYLNIQ